MCGNCERECESAQVRESGNAQVRECASAQVRECAMRKYASPRMRACAGANCARTQVRQCANARMCKGVSARVRKCASAQVRDDATARSHDCETTTPGLESLHVDMCQELKSRPGNNPSHSGEGLVKALQTYPHSGNTRPHSATDLCADKRAEKCIVLFVFRLV